MMSILHSMPASVMLACCSRAWVVFALIFSPKDNIVQGTLIALTSAKLLMANSISFCMMNCINYEGNLQNSYSIILSS